MSNNQHDEHNHEFNADEMLQMMAQKMGGLENVPDAIKFAKDVAPELMMQVMMSSKDSIEDEKSPLDPKTRQFIYFAAALATHDSECIKATTHSLSALGATKEEIVSVIKIVRHAANNGILGAATPILRELKP
jgi:AhpD family alkylhydroperoxidase